MARRQEQEPARQDVTEVAPGVLRMELPIRMPGLGHVNCYAIVDREGAAVVDPGLPGPGTWRAIQDRLRRADLAVRHVHTVIVTHSHPDHFGGASRFAREAGARIIGHEHFRFGAAPAPHAGEVSAEHLTEVETEEAAEAPVPGRTPWGGRHPRPPLRLRLRWRVMGWLGRSFVPRLTDTVRAGEVLRLAGREWQVVHTPGHTEDHVCLLDRSEGIFLAGDHVLPTITPHISGLARSADPLDDFFDSLARAAALPDVRLALPAHGHPFTDLAGRCDEIRQHHLERLEKVKGIGRLLGPATVEAFSQRLFQPRSWGEMAESETYAHLEHLRLLGDAARSRDGQGRFVYETG